MPARDMAIGAYEFPAGDNPALEFHRNELLRASALIQGRIEKCTRLRFMLPEFNDPAVLWAKLLAVFGSVKDKALALENC